VNRASTGARRFEASGITSVLHTWGSALTHHPHVHMIVPGGGISLDGTRWVSCRPGFFLSVRVLSRPFRRLFLEKLVAAHQLSHPCPCCGGPMSIIESFARGSTPRHQPTAPMISMRIDTS
jgi:hypothetical protein